jgi:hypothetical protein
LKAIGITSHLKEWVQICITFIIHHLFQLEYSIFIMNDRSQDVLINIHQFNPYQVQQGNYRNPRKVILNVEVQGRVSWIWWIWNLLPWSSLSFRWRCSLSLWFFWQHQEDQDLRTHLEWD